MLLFRMLLQRHVVSLSTGCSVAQKNDLLDRRQKLEARISAYEHRILDIMKLDDETLWSTEVRKHREIDSELADASDDVLVHYSEDWFTPERENITLPSALAPGEIERQSLQSIALIEAELRKGQVSDALEGLRLALGEKSLCFRRKCGMPTASERRIAHGTECINLMPMLDDTAPHIDMHGMPYDSYKLTRNIWARFTILLMMT